MNTNFKMWSLYPFILRDISIWAGEEDKEKLKKIIKDNAGELLVKEPYVFDSFKKDGKISYAFRLVFQSFERTLTDEEINVIMTKIANKIKDKNGWQVR
ncbi:hypothetical protein A2818_01325 [Candidatus Nomurabacteria bacterium RIFCSPHIGHO2_01_FULL_40_12]|uniref:FDX-ACB domain-containing protein n=1 Tax=Candidatus Nomurabacteria bacterium RIFCSPHIGHO2_01_FULL_40_12 TaxID=1801737 RepID=A0A1F6V1K1_9BACT|nr:MAG: hypothetical protein A2818_01325 [Candidatus Nomurabacteria bacterium RIFCSPHIGHO2_01_FULL_40_12]